MTLSRSAASALLSSHRLVPRRALGQNFMVDPNSARRIARLSGVKAGDHVIEIGPGLGSLTLALAETGASVTAVEVDRHLLPVLEETLRGTSVEIVNADAMTCDWDRLLADSDDWKLVANLPYNIATPLVAELLDRVPKITSMLVLVQREVASRLAANVGDREYGAVSVKVRYWAEATIAGSVPASVFLPRPRVESALVSIRRRVTGTWEMTDAERERMFRLVRTGFAKRRKMLRGSLAGLLDSADIARAGVDPSARAEDLDTDAWRRLAGIGSGGSH